MLAKKEKILAINCSYITSSFQDLFPYDIDFFYSDSKRINYVNQSESFICLIKYFVNFIYRFLRKKNIQKGMYVIRSWVDVDEKIYEKYFNDGLIFIYPFPMNIKRGLKYIKHCFSNYKNVSLMGLPYSFTKLFIIFISKKKDIAILNYELDAYQRHVKDFIGYDTIYTSDEYQTSVYALYQKLNDSTKIINTAHGVGFYNPYTNYDEFNVINDYQKNYYAYKNKNTVFKVMEAPIVPTYSLDNSGLSIIIVDQGNLEKYGYLYESKLQKKVNEEIFRICDDRKIKCFVKFHPNRTENERKNFNGLDKFCHEVKNLNNMKDKNIIFINLYSGAYYDYLHLGKFIFIKEDYFDPRVFFSDNIKISSIEMLEKNIINSVN